MKLVTTKSNIELSPIGIGTYGIGGRGHRDIQIKDRREESVYVPAIIKQLNYGYNFTEISLGYGHGNSVKYFSKALEEINFKRENLFLTNSIYPRDISNFSQIEEDVESMYKIFNTDYFDSTLVTQSLIVKFGYSKIINILWQLLDSNRTRYVSISNANKDLIKQFSQEFKNKVFAHETHLSFEIRLCQDEGIFELTDSLDIQTIIWRPLRQGKTILHSWEPLVRLSKKYNKTQNQIVLNWMCYLGFKPLVFSTSDNHIKENWESTQFKMLADEYLELTNYRIPNYIPPKIDWSNIGNGDSIVPPVMGFEEDYAKSINI